MGRYTGPVERLSRRAGVELELKGERRLNGKSALERRGAQAPGQHGLRARRLSLFAQQLREKQIAKRYYGVRERQFRRYLTDAARQHDVRTGEALLRLLELRLDNVVYRLGLATTRAQARQFVAHGHVLVNGERCTIASRRLRPGDTVAIRAESPVEPAARHAIELIARVAPWLQADHDALAGTVLRLPERREIDTPVIEQMVIEHARHG